MLELLIILMIAIIIAAVLFVLLKKILKTALFVVLVFVVFVIISSIIFPETNIFEKGKNYILERAEGMLEKGKDKVTAYVVVEANETISKAKEKIIDELNQD